MGSRDGGCVIWLLEHCTTHTRVRTHAHAHTHCRVNIIPKAACSKWSLPGLSFAYSFELCLTIVTLPLVELPPLV